jgi:putative FmdB family regulatory protein
MPIYEYRCEACGRQQEILQKMSDAPLTVCPECGEPRLVKMVTAAGFQLKGSGWYATDFRQPAQSKTKAADKPAAKSEDKAASKAEDKPAAAKKTEAAPSASTSGASTANT